MLGPSSSAMFFETTIFSARLVSHAKNSSTKEASSSDGEESLSKIFSKKFCVLFCGSYSWSGLYHTLKGSLKKSDLFREANFFGGLSFAITLPFERDSVGWVKTAEDCSWQRVDLCRF